MAPHSSTLAWKIPWTEGLVGCSRVRLFETPWTIAGQAPLSMEFSRQEYWSGLPFPSLGDHPNADRLPYFKKSDFKLILDFL